MRDNHFLNMIQHLRKNEEVMLYTHILEISEEDCKEIAAFLEQEYKTESLNYPHSCPPFNEEAALWAAKTIYTAAQLLLYREHKEADLALLLPCPVTDPSAAELLTGDLCLRFLPGLLNQLKLIDGEDKLVMLLEEILTQWHFSGVSYPLAIEKLVLKNSTGNACLHQLYVDRIILHKRMPLARHPAFESLIAAGLGLYAQELWNEFKTGTI